MRTRGLVVMLAIAAVACTACGGAPRATSADLAAIHQPTPDPTLDAVVRDLPHALAGVVPPTPTPTPMPKPQVKASTPTVRPSPKPPTLTPTPTPTKPRR
jgi:hypothetical protein